MLRKYLQKYGDIEAFVLSSQKRGSALVEFKTQEGAEMAVAYEKGLQTNPLTLSWIGAPPRSKSNPSASTTLSDKDYESVVLRNLRLAEERKKLIADMLKEDETGES